MSKIKKFSTKLKKIREQMRKDNSAKYELECFIDHALAHPSWEGVRQSELEHDDFEQELLNRIELLTEDIDSYRYRLQLEKDRWGPKIKSRLAVRELYLGISSWLHYQKPEDIRPRRYVSPLSLYKKPSLLRLLKDKKKDEEKHG